MSRQHIFFQQFGMPGMHQEIQIQPDPNYLYNTMLLELASSWAFVRWLMCQYRENTLVNVDPVEGEWLQFIISNNIDVEKYEKNTELFLEENFKMPV